MKLIATLFTVLLLGIQNLNAQASCAAAFAWGSNVAALGSTSCLTGGSGAFDTSIEPGWTGSQCGAVVTREVWVQFSITDSSLPDYLFTVSNTSTGGPGTRPFGFQIFTGACGSLTLLDCDNDAAGGGQETETLNDLPNGTYYLRLIGYGSGFNFEICITNVAPPPTNDDCINATPVTVGINGICNKITGTNVGATTSTAPAPGCGNFAGGDVWYSIVVPASGNVTFATDYATTNTLTDTDIAIYSGTCGALTLIECDDLDGVGLMGNINRTGLTPGTTIYVRVWQWGNNALGNFDLCISEPPPPSNNQDCVTKEALCSSATLAGASNGSGSVTDLSGSNRGCLSIEHQASWYNLKIATAGTFAFTLSPNNGSDDYDFGVWYYSLGAGQTCPPNRNPDRCSFAAGSGLGGSYDTGMGMGATDTSEGVSGDNWVSPLNVVTDDELVLLIDNFSVTTSPFTIDFTGTAGLDCSISVLPVELLSFYAKKNGKHNLIHWSTASELNNNYFTIEQSNDGENWREIGKISGAGNSTERLDYELVHFNPELIVNYYRLHQTDYDGTKSNYKIVSLNNTNNGKTVVKTTNLLGQEVDHYFKGVVVDIYEDGSTQKRYQ